MRILTTIFALLLTAGFSFAQVLSVDPVFPQANGTVTIIYDATKGNGALVGVTPIYAHTGVITSASTGPTDWRHVQGNWGTADANVVMEDLGNNKHRISYNINDFYSVPGGEDVEKLAFVFRNEAGDIVGREADGSDIFTAVYSGNSALLTTYITPAEQSFIAEMGQTISISAAASVSSNLTLFDNGSMIAQGTGTELNHDLTVTTAGNHTVEFVADNNGTSSTSSFTYVVSPDVTVQSLPAGLKHGINYTSPTTATLVLYAPFKDNVYVIGDFNGWSANTDYFMKRSTDNATYWIELTGLTEGEEYAFQYLVDGELKVADPYSEVVLDSWNDSWIPTVTYPNLPDYPTGKATGYVSVLQPGRVDYEWEVTNFAAPEKTDLVVYELLVRDFLARHDYETLLDTLDYLEKLGVNAIELMPIQEFEGNESWGYNPSFHMATDKYYGTINDYKAFIDEAHKRGIAVIMDVVFNHAFSQSPLAQLYWDDANFRPAPGNPWLNVNATHPFNVGYDFNHESQATKDFMDRVLEYWAEEFKIDGFRFDLSKGFTQMNSGDNVGIWSGYDGSRITILKRMADALWAVDNDSYIILEHFGNNDEEKELANYGMMLWGNLTHDYQEAAMGYTANFNWSSYITRGWNDPHVVMYMESHDEERLMYKSLQFGNGAGGYDIKEVGTALDRIELVGAFFYTVPGPKMLWQFGEVGYDYSINHCPDGTIDEDCRVANKPIRWDYYEDVDRKDLYNAFSAMIHLKTENEVFHTTDYSMSTSSTNKSIHLNHESMDVTIIGNFGVTANSINPAFQHSGWWYDYMTGDSINITNTTANISLEAGEYHIYTDKYVSLPTGLVTTGVEDIKGNNSNLSIYPNPSKGTTTVSYELSAKGVVSVEVYNVLGQRVVDLVNEEQQAGVYQFTWNGQSNTGSTLNSGTYFVRITANGSSYAMPLVLVKE